MHYYKFNIGDYARSTRHLTNDEDLAFRRLLDMYYETESPIPLETRWVARRIRIDTDVIKALLNDMFIRTEEGWRHPRCDAEIDEYHRQADRNRGNGKRGGRPKTAVKHGLENPVGSEWEPSGNPVGSEWEPSGNPVGSEWEPSGNPVVTLTTKHKPLTINHEPLTINHEPVIIEGYPLWLPIDSWNGWVEMRKQRERPLTDRAKARAYKKLEALHIAGHDINELLDRSTINGWLDIYDPKGTQNAGNSKHAAEPTNPMVRAVIASQARRATDGKRPTDDWA